MGLSDADLASLGYENWKRNLIDGIASHHAGVIPLFKEVIEELFARGAVKAVFATETLSLGINMAARTVVIESLTKYSGTEHRAWELESVDAPFRNTLDLGPARVPESQHACHLVESFSGRIVAGLTQQEIAAPLRHVEQQCVPTRHNQSDERWLYRRIFEQCGKDVTLEVVHAYQSAISRCRKCFRVTHSDHQ